MLAYKFLRPGAVAPFTGFSWPEGDWIETPVPLEPCRRGVHACTRDYLPEWLESELWQIELDGTISEAEGLLVAQRGRLAGRIEAWNGAAAREFAHACAGRLRERIDQDERFAFYAEVAAGVADSTTDRKFYALASYVARHAAEDVSPGGWETERARQVDWLVERLALEQR